MFGFLKKETSVELKAPTSGLFVPLAAVSDEVFASKAVGDGFAVTPAENANQVVSPIDGVVSSIFPTKHAIMLTTKAGVEILLHLGIDTVELNGAPFTMLVTEGAKVQQGAPLVTVDWSQVIAAYKETTVMVVSANATFELADAVTGEVSPATTIGTFKLMTD